MRFSGLTSPLHSDAGDELVSTESQSVTGDYSDVHLWTENMYQEIQFQPVIIYPHERQSLDAVECKKVQMFFFLWLTMCTNTGSAEGV